MIPPTYNTPGLAALEAMHKVAAKIIAIAKL